MSLCYLYDYHLALLKVDARWFEIDDDAGGGGLLAVSAANKESDDNAQEKVCVNIVCEVYDLVRIFRLGSLHTLQLTRAGRNSSCW